jgi:hypothetical protein
MIILRSKENSNHCFSASRSHLFLTLLTTSQQIYYTTLPVDVNPYENGYLIASNFTKESDVNIFIAKCRVRF